MKTIFLLLGVGFISLQGFAGSSKEDTKPGDKNGGILKTVLETAKNLKPGHKAKTQWLSRLNDESNWQERVRAVKDWKTVFHHAPEEIFDHLESRLSDKSQKVREAVVTAFEEMAAEDPVKYPASIQHFYAEEIVASTSNYSSIIKALAERRPNDTKSLFLRKMKTATEIFKSTTLYTVRESQAVFEELEVSGLDQTLTALYEMTETGLADKKSAEMRKGSLQLLDATLDKLIRVKTHRRLFATSKAEIQVSDYVLQGIRIAVAGLADKNPEVRSAAKALLSKTFQPQNLYTAHVAMFIPEVAKAGFSHSNHEIRIDTINWLLEIEKPYASLGSNVLTLAVLTALEARQAKENSLRMKVALKKARGQLFTSENTDACRESLSG